MRPKKRRKRRKQTKSNQRNIIIISIGILLLFCLVYLIWPFYHTLNIENSKTDPVLAKINITKNGNDVFSGIRNYNSIRLWKGTYNISIDAKGYEKQEFILENKIGLKLNKNINQTIKLKPKYVNFSHFGFFDPTTSLNLGVNIAVKGKNILGDYVYFKTNNSQAVMYGDYLLNLQTRNKIFVSSADIRGDLIFQNNKSVKKVILSPGNSFLKISVEEGEQVLNFVSDFMNLSQTKYLDIKDRGLPKQFYLYKQNKIISLGDMLFLFCEKSSFNEMNVSPGEYFIPKQQVYWFEDSVNTSVQCYSRSLIGAIPSKINKVRFEDVIFKQNFDYSMSNLNSKHKGIDVAFTFDIESGRYVFDNKGISPCFNTDFSLGLDHDEKICDKPEYVAWMTPRDSSISYDQYNYPVVSGILGYKQILDYSNRYGIPVTNYYVKKDLITFNLTAPELIKTTKELVDKGLIEVGSHTRYHTHVGLVSKHIASEEMLESKKFLENIFNYKVVGFRAPYLGLINDEVEQAQVLQRHGYKYFTQLGNYSGKVSDTTIQHKQWNSDWKYVGDIKPAKMRDLLYSKDYLITLDHPWNIGYKGDKILVEDPTLFDKHRANVLTVISNGGIPVMAKDITVPQKAKT